MARNPGSIQRLWWNWKMMRLPWRRRWLVGFDLQGNTFWEFKDALHSNRNRRIVKYSRWTHYGDVNVAPQWMQWLRHTRFEPPTLAEQQADVYRQDQIKYLAAQADQRWAEKPSMLDMPDKQQPVQPLVSGDIDSGVRQTNVDQQPRDEAEPPKVAAEVDQKTQHAPSRKSRVRKEPKGSPWGQHAQTNPGDEWQPQSWSPPPAQRRA